MGQIVRRKKKVRPSNSDPALPPSASKSKSPARESDYRRSLRRRNARTIIDYDNYLDEYEEEVLPGDEDQEEEGEDETISVTGRRNKKKKLKLAVKLPVEFNSRGGVYDEEEEEADGPNYLDEENHDEDEEGGPKGDSKGLNSAPGTHAETQNMVPLPDKKWLELILNKLQKKDIYGVYAEPVDPDELPDYYDIIKHPMDFSTIRNKLANGKYSTLDQIERDVFLICSNAMQYNAPDTIYHKQAHTIQEMAKKKFQKVQSDFERSEKQINTEERNKFNRIPMNPVKQSICRSSQEPVGSDFLSGAALATTGESNNGLNMSQVGSIGTPISNDVPVEVNVSTVENDINQVEELISGKDVPYGVAKKPFLVDENRRTTYKILNKMTMGSDSVLTTFEKEPKELVSVGLQAENSYARSLARFAGTLGPVAWNIAAKNIKDAVPRGIKFGRGWVGEYEPLSTPFLKLESHCNLGAICLPALPDIINLKAEVKQKSRAPAGLNLGSQQSNKDPPFNEPVLEVRPSLFTFSNDSGTRRKPPSVSYAASRPVTPVNIVNRGLNSVSRNHLNGNGEVGSQGSLSSACTANPDKMSFGAAVLLSENSYVSTQCTSQAPSKSMLLKQSECGGLVSCGVSTAKIMSSAVEKSQLVDTFSQNVSGLTARTEIHFGRGEEQQGLCDPVHLMRMLAEKVQNLQNFASHSPDNVSSVAPSVSSPRRDDSVSGSQISPCLWMSIGSKKINKPAAESPSMHRSHISVDSLYNPARDVQQVMRFRGETSGSLGLHFQTEKNHLPGQKYGQENIWFAQEAHSQGHSVNIMKLVTADLSRFQMQSPGQGLSSRLQTRQTLPPDLNIGFESSGSPARQVTQVDTLQPDLALQL